MEATYHLACIRCHRGDAMRTPDMTSHYYRAWQYAPLAPHLGKYHVCLHSAATVGSSAAGFCTAGTDLLALVNCKILHRWHLRKRSLKAVPSKISFFCYYQNQP